MDAEDPPFLHGVHTRKVNELQNQIASWTPAPTKRYLSIRRQPHQSHSTRDYGYKDKCDLVDISLMNQIININVKEKTAVVEPLVTMEELVLACLPHHLIPCVVPEFKGITVGGAIQGLGVESSSFRFECLPDNCLWIDVVTGDGSLLRVSPTNYPDLFYGVQGSFGSLCLVVQIKLKLMDAKPYIRLRYEVETTSSGFQDRLQYYCRSSIQTDKIQSPSTRNGLPAPDFLEGIAYDQSNYVIILGYQSDYIQNENTEYYTLQPYDSEFFYEHVERMTKMEKQGNIVTKQTLMPLVDYLFRYDKSTFWASNTKKSKLSLWLSNWMFSSANIWKMNQVMSIAERESRRFLQDPAIPLSVLGKSIDFLNEMLEVKPMWCCPVRHQYNEHKIFSESIGGIAKEDDFWVDCGVYGTPNKQPFYAYEANRKFEQYLRDLGAIKALFAVCYSSRDEFWQSFDKEKYEQLRNKYNAAKFMDIYDKVSAHSCVQQLSKSPPLPIVKSPSLFQKAQRLFLLFKALMLFVVFSLSERWYGRNHPKLLAN